MPRYNGESIRANQPAIQSASQARGKPRRPVDARPGRTTERGGRLCRVVQLERNSLLTGALNGLADKTVVKGKRVHVQA